MPCIQSFVEGEDGSAHQEWSCLLPDGSCHSFHCDPAVEHLDVVGAVSLRLVVVSAGLENLARIGGMRIV